MIIIMFSIHVSKKKCLMKQCNIVKTVDSKNYSLNKNIASK